jgi:CBS domain-containing protein
MTETTEMTVGSVMTPDPVAVRPHTGFKEILELLTRHNISAVPVVSATGVVMGEVSEVDLLRARRRHRGGRLTAVELMRSPGTMVSPDTTLAAATTLLARSRTHRVFVTDTGRLVGVLTARDALRPLCRPDKEILAEIEHGLPANSVRVNVHGGVVQLTGRLPEPFDLDAALTRISGIPGVVDLKERTR